jgi:hypothetical protein
MRKLASPGKLFSPEAETNDPDPEGILPAVSPGIFFETGFFSRSFIRT